MHEQSILRHNWKNRNIETQLETLKERHFRIKRVMRVKIYIRNKGPRTR